MPMRKAKSFRKFVIELSFHVEKQFKSIMYSMEMLIELVLKVNMTLNLKQIDHEIPKVELDVRIDEKQKNLKKNESF